MSLDEIWKVVFPFLEGKELVTCMLVCKQWRDIAEDDYFWKCLCARRWPSVCKQSSPPAMSYQNLFRTFYKRQRNRTLLPPRLSFEDIVFYVDIWTEEKLIFSEVIPGPVLQNGMRDSVIGSTDVLNFHLFTHDYKMIMPMQKRFSIPVGTTASASVLVSRKDTKKVACVVNKSAFNYIDRSTYRALAFDFLDFSPAYPFVSNIRAWISLHFVDHGDDEGVDVYAIELDFCDAAKTEDQILWLLDMLDWK